MVFFLVTARRLGAARHTGWSRNLQVSRGQQPSPCRARTPRRGSFTGLLRAATCRAKPRTVDRVSGRQFVRSLRPALISRLTACGQVARMP